MVRARSSRTAARQTQFAEFQLDSKTAPCVPAIREAVAAWRRKGHPGATDTTKQLLNHWFHSDHRLPNGNRFSYHYFQRDAVETLVYLWEVERIRTRTQLLEKYAHDLNLALPKYDLFARYAVKMATGSGKTKVMSLAVAWQYLNAAREENPDYAKTFLVIAPNVIVFERLRTDFEGGRIFRTDPVIPKHMQVFWDFDCVMRGEGERAPTDGTLFLANVQQLYEREDKRGAQEPDEMLGVLGFAPKPQQQQGPSFAERITRRDGPLLVLNDEGHHTHDEDNEWNKVIRSLHSERPLAAQLDFSATPRFQKGALFPWTVFDYPLKTAIFENIVKRPMKGVANIDEAKSDIASIRYQGFLVAGVNRWREYREQLEPLGKNPILFIMMNSTTEADDVADWLRAKYPSEFGGSGTLVIHTDNTGEVSKKDLDKAREVARAVDNAEQPVNAIVSVLMLREGWDVQNVTVVVGLRPYTAKANILPEQTIGRGLRLMFRGEGSGYTERVDVIGNPKFIEFVEDLEKTEGVQLDTFEVGKDKLHITTIAPDLDKAEYDLGIPQLTPALMRKRTLAEEIAAIDVEAFQLQPLPLEQGTKAEETFTYEGFDILTLEKMVDRAYQMPEPQTSGEVIGYYARLIASRVRLPGQFAHIAPKVREFFAYKAFGQPVDLEDKLTLRAMSRPLAEYVVVSLFEKALKEVLIEDVIPELHAPERPLSTCPPFPFSRGTYEARKSIFNLTPCDSGFECAFAEFLDRASDVGAFAKLPLQFGFAVEYTDASANLRHYYPDFVVEDNSGGFWLIETKGLETAEVQYKDRAAKLWCENATLLTGKSWSYIKVPQREYERLNPEKFSDLAVLEGSAGGRVLSLEDRTVAALIANGESDKVEFKESARWMVKEDAFDEEKKLEFGILKTIAAFLNSQFGGTLFIGVRDDGSFAGLERDYSTIERHPNQDGFVQWLSQSFGKAFGYELTNRLVRVSFHKLDGKDVCRVKVRPSDRPVYLEFKMKGQPKSAPQLYIRHFYSSRALTGADLEDYLSRRWGVEH